MAIPPPSRVRPIRRQHMDLVEEHRILNGHYKRLMMAKPVIDTKTPRSFYTNPRKRQQLDSNARQSNDSIQNRPQSRSRSASNWRASPKKNCQSPITVITSPALNSNFSRSASRLDMPRTTASAGNLVSVINPRVTTSKKSPSFEFKQRSMSNQYERRFIDNDIADQHFYLFNQPSKPFQPRRLLFNLAQSEIAKQTKNYQPPFWKMRAHPLRTAKVGVPKEAEPNGSASPGHPNSGEISPSKSFLSPQLSPTVGFRPGTKIYSPPFMDKEHYGGNYHIQGYKISEQDEWRFMREVTRDIITAQSFSDRILFHIFSQAIKRWRNTIPVPRMRLLLTKLMDDIKVPRDGILSVYVEEEPNTLQKNVSTSAQIDAARGESDYENDKFEDDAYDSDVEGIDSLSEEDMKNILQGKNLENLYQRMEVKKNQKKEKKKTEKKEKIEEKKEKDPVPIKRGQRESAPIISDKLSEKSSSIHQRQGSSGKLSNSGQSSEADSVESLSKQSTDKRKRSSRKSSRSDSDKAEAKSVSSSNEEETAAEVSDIEEDRQVETNGQKIHANSSGVKLSLDEVKGAEQSNESSSYGELRLDVAPPEKLNSDSNVPSPAVSSNGSVQPSRQLSLQSNGEREHSLSSSNGNLHLNISAPDFSAEPEKSKKQILSNDEVNSAADIRRKRESFLRTLETNSRRLSGEKEASLTSSNSSRKSSKGKLNDTEIEGHNEQFGSKDESIDDDLDQLGELEANHPDDIHSDHLPKITDQTLPAVIEKRKISLSLDHDMAALLEDVHSEKSDNPLSANSIVGIPKPLPRRSRSRPSTDVADIFDGLNQSKRSSIQSYHDIANDSLINLANGDNENLSKADIMEGQGADKEDNF